MGKIFVLDEIGIEHLLSQSLVGRIACASSQLDDGRPVIVPIAYAYDGEAVYAASPLGQKIHIMRDNPRVSFEVDDVSAEDRWLSVVAQGDYEELTTPSQREHGMTILTRGTSIVDVPADHIVFRIRFTARSGRFEVPDAEAEAYTSPSHPGLPNR